jgi:hypothetical protein
MTTGDYRPDPTVKTGTLPQSMAATIAYRQAVFDSIRAFPGYPANLEFARWLYGGGADTLADWIVNRVMLEGQ